MQKGVDTALQVRPTVGAGRLLPMKLMKRFQISEARRDMLKITEAVRMATVVCNLVNLLYL